jgi:hypothetical protein
MLGKESPQILADLWDVEKTPAHRVFDYRVETFASTSNLQQIFYFLVPVDVTPPPHPP